MRFKSLLPIYLGAMITPLGGVGVIPLLPVMAQEWGISIQWVSLTVTLYMVPFVVFQLFSGPIAQVFDTRKTLLFGFGVYALGGFLSAISTNLMTLLGARIIQGFGAAFIAPIILALVGELGDPQHVGKTMGIVGIMYTVGVTMGPLISGVLEVGWGWPSFFFLLAGLAMIIGVMVAVTNSSQKGRGRGSVNFAEALALVPKAFFVADVRLLSLAAFFLFMGYIGLMTFMADYLKTSFSLPSDKIGMILSMTGFTGILASPIAGVLGDRFGRRPIAYTGMSVMSGALLGLAFSAYSYERYLLFFAVFGVGSATSWTSLNTLAVQLVPDLRKPVASLYSSLKFSGYALAPLVLSILYVPFSISGARWGCLACILLSLFLISRLRSPL